MRLKNIFNRPQEPTLPLFDEGFLRRLERLSFRTAPALRGSPLGERRSRNLRPALDFSDHRSYSPGDDLRHVDWNAYGRHEQLFVKLGEATQSVNIHILLDCSRSMAWAATHKSSARRPATYSKWDAARRLAGALGYLGLAGGERVEITPFGHNLAEGFGPTEGKRRVVPILKFLSGVMPLPPAKGETGGGLVPSLTSYARVHPAGGLLVLISDLLDTVSLSAFEAEAGEELAQSLRHLVPPRWQVLVVHLLTEEEVQPTIEGDYDLQDTETDESLPFHLDNATLTQYRLRVRTWCAALQSACGQRGATYARVLAEWPLEQMVIPYLRQRGVVQ
jgi:uncharacterized protein (DUF58 family)